MYSFLAVLLFLSSGFPLKATAREKGYDEAMEYFVERKKHKASRARAKTNKRSRPEINEDGKNSRPTPVDSFNNIIIDPEKYFVGFGVGEIFGEEHYSLELGVSLLQTRYLQQSIHFEYINFSTANSPDFRAGNIQNTRGQGLFLVQSVQLSSQVFFMGPEISAGVGRISSNPQKGALLVMKAGLSFSNRWSRRFLFSGHLYYRRSQYFKKDHHGEGLGLTLRFGF